MAPTYQLRLPRHHIIPALLLLSMSAYIVVKTVIDQVWLRLPFGPVIAFVAFACAAMLLYLAWIIGKYAMLHTAKVESGSIVIRNASGKHAIPVQGITSIAYESRVAPGGRWGFMAQLPKATERYWIQSGTLSIDVHPDLFDPKSRSTIGMVLTEICSCDVPRQRGSSHQGGAR